MKYLIVIDGTDKGRPTRNYLCRPRGFRGRSGAWTGQPDKATEFSSRDEAQQIIETIMKLKSGVLIVSASEDPQGATGSRSDVQR
jgi:hypothetical protein